ncbi:unnamed protein product [Paramecium sonneborni]|uniref:Uncharacterized protein n=1 Tax=Paramecium sonneborni TaxID=65129 RepID=A0A8S1Q9W9_9CILI|nr:unnamed protein product [Paramecium sonneborni]
MSKETVPMFKFIVLGDQSVGKSSFVKQYSESIFIEAHKPTIGVEFVKKMVVVDKRKVELQIWDTAGQEQFRSMIKSFYRGAAAVFVLYSVNSRDSFEKLDQWLQELQESAHEEIVKILVGNKSDLDRDISKEEAEKFMNENNFSLFFETSAKTGENVEKAFEDTVKLVIMRMFTSESFKNSIKTTKKTPANSRQNTSRSEPLEDFVQTQKPIQLQVTPQTQQKQEKQCC